MKKIILKIDGMSCSACSSSLEKYLNSKEDIISANVNLVMAQALIFYKDNLELEDLNNYIKEAGFTSLGIYNYDDFEDKNKKEFKKIVIMSIIAILIMYISMGHMLNLPTIPLLDMQKNPISYTLTLLIMIIPFLWYGMDILKKGIKSLIHKSPNMDTLVSISVLSSLIYSIFSFIMIIIGHSEYINNLYFDSCSMVILFIKIGRYIEEKNKNKTKEAIKELVQITPQKATLKVEDGEREVNIDEVKEQDILIVRPGNRIAVDGEIVSGEGHINEMILTGESFPKKKKKGDKVIAGSLNIDGYIEYKALKIGKNSTISEVVRLVVEASNTKPPIAKLANKICLYFTPFVLIVSIITLIVYIILGADFSIALNRFVTILVVACPCALGLATPLAITISEGVCAQNLIVVKSSEILEKAHKIKKVIFDKTGTLTLGKLQINDIYNYGKYDDETILNIVASLELKSSHPIAKVFCDYAKEKKMTLQQIDNFKNIEGVGIVGNILGKQVYLGNNKLLSQLKLGYNKQYLDKEKELAKLGNSIIYVIIDCEVVALIGVSDHIKDDAKSVIEKLHKQNIEVVMLTGDNIITSTTIAKVLDIKTVVAGISPKEKHEYIKNLIDNGEMIMMVGDGINDAPSLALSDIGVSFASATDIASNSADVVLLNNNLENVITLLNISKKTIRNIKENLFWAFCYNIFMIPLAMGIFEKINLHINPMIASLCMILSSILVVLNALRLRIGKFKHK